MVALMTRVRFTVDQYDEMGRAGILSEKDRVELIEGEIIAMSPVGARHMACVKRSSAWLFRLLGNKYILSVQDPIRLGLHNEPQPDVAVLKWRIDYYAARKPTASDTLLVIEVAETSYDYDINVKVPLYAQAGIPEVLVADLMGDKIKYCADPVNGVYQIDTDLKRGQTIPSRAVPGLTLAVNAILG